MAVVTSKITIDDVWTEYGAGSTIKIVIETHGKGLVFFGYGPAAPTDSQAHRCVGNEPITCDSAGGDRLWMRAPNRNVSATITAE